MEIEKLNSSHKRSGFCCGIESLNDYIQKKAMQDLRRHLSVTYVLNSEDKIVAGFYTLSSTTIELVDLSNEISRKLPGYPLIPSTLIGRLAVDKRYQKRGFGEILLVDALHRAHTSSTEIASFAVVVEAINKNAIQFYEKYGFTSFVNSEDMLYLPIKMVEKI